MLTKVRTKKKGIEFMIDKLYDDIKSYGIGENSAPYQLS